MFVTFITVSSLFGDQF